jgi:hypothetical protein
MRFAKQVLFAIFTTVLLIACDTDRTPREYNYMEISGVLERVQYDSGSGFPDVIIYFMDGRVKKFAGPSTEFIFQKSKTNVIKYSRTLFGDDVIEHVEIVN